MPGHWPPRRLTVSKCALRKNVAKDVMEIVVELPGTTTVLDHVVGAYRILIHPSANKISSIRERGHMD